MTVERLLKAHTDIRSHFTRIPALWGILSIDLIEFSFSYVIYIKRATASQAAFWGGDEKLCNNYSSIMLILMGFLVYANVIDRRLKKQWVDTQTPLQANADGNLDFMVQLDASGERKCDIYGYEFLLCY